MQLALPALTEILYFLITLQATQTQSVIPLSIIKFQQFTRDVQKLKAT